MRIEGEGQVHSLMMRQAHYLMAQSSTICTCSRARVHSLLYSYQTTSQRTLVRAVTRGREAHHTHSSNVQWHAQSRNLHSLLDNHQANTCTHIQAKIDILKSYFIVPFIVSSYRFFLSMVLLLLIRHALLIRRMLKLYFKHGAAALDTNKHSPR